MRNLVCIAFIYSTVCPTGSAESISADRMAIKHTTCPTCCTMSTSDLVQAALRVQLFTDTIHIRLASIHSRSIDDDSYSFYFHSWPSCSVIFHDWMSGGNALRAWSVDLLRKWTAIVGSETQEVVTHLPFIRTLLCFSAGGVSHAVTPRPRWRLSGNFTDGTIRNWWPKRCNFLVYLFVPNQLYMFRAMFSSIIRSTWLYLQLLI